MAKILRTPNLEHTTDGQSPEDQDADGADEDSEERLHEDNEAPPLLES